MDRRDFLKLTTALGLVPMAGCTSPDETPNNPPIAPIDLPPEPPRPKVYIASSRAGLRDAAFNEYFRTQFGDKYDAARQAQLTDAVRQAIRDTAHNTMGLVKAYQAKRLHRGLDTTAGQFEEFYTTWAKLESGLDPLVRGSGGVGLMSLNFRVIRRGGFAEFGVATEADALDSSKAMNVAMHLLQRSVFASLDEKCTTVDLRWIQQASPHGIPATPYAMRAHDELGAVDVLGARLIDTPDIGRCAV